jgi:Ca2+-binding RTX toxin-like protein
VVGWLVLTTPAAAAPTCAFDQATATVTIGVGDGESAVISQTGGSITLDGTACDVATVTNTDLIDVNGSGTPVEISIDLSAGNFAPGLTPDADGGSSEIEFSVDLPNGTPTLRVSGGAGNDNLVYGADGINLNAAETPGDVDVSIVGAPLIVLDGNAGNDALSIAGGAGTGAPAVGSMNGGTEDDLLGGGLGGSTAGGGDGVDTIDYAAASQVVASLATGVVQHAGGQTDQLAGVENLSGSPGADTISGDDGPNVLQGGLGDDLLIGGGGDDSLSGGDGRDTLAFLPSEGGVEVDLREGTSEGEGNDTLTGFENVIGTAVADTIHADGGVNLVDGGRGSDEIFGRDGSDALLGSQGNDQLFGQKGNDNVSGGPGRDQLDGGQGKDRCRGGPHPDAFVFCEVIRLD